MTDQEVLELLIRIDGGYEPTESEKKELSSIQKITWKGVEKIPKCIELMTGLKVLAISGEFFNKSSLTIIPESIGNLSGFQTLNLRSTQISTLPESIGNLSGLQTLNLGFTQISTLPESIGNLSSLQTLNLRSTQISTLPESIGNLSNLLHLDLSKLLNSELPQKIGTLENLKELIIEDNILSELPEELLSLELEYNNEENSYRDDGPGIYIHGL